MDPSRLLAYVTMACEALRGNQPEYTRLQPGLLASVIRRANRVNPAHRRQRAAAMSHRHDRDALASTQGTQQAGGLRVALAVPRRMRRIS